MILPSVLALGANLSFATASVVFAEYSSKNSPLWMNCFKALCATVAFGLTLLVLQIWTTPLLVSVICLFCSGMIGLMLGDLFLLRAYTIIGASRSLMIFGFQPVALGIASYYLFGQEFPLYRIFAVACMFLCLFTLSLENFKRSGSWQLNGLVAGLIGVALDALGVLVTRYAFEASPALSPIQGNFIRCLGALFGFTLIGLFIQPVHLKQKFLRWPTKIRTKLIIASLAGTYLSLLLYLTAVKSGHLASVSSVAITSPMFAALFECIKQKKWPTPYLLIGFVFFVTGFLILLS